MYKLKRCIMMGVLISLTFLISADVIFAAEEDSVNRWGIGYRYRYVHPDDEDYKKGGGKNSNNLTVTYRAYRNLFLEFEAGHFQLQTDVGSKMDVTSAYLSVQYLFLERNVESEGGKGAANDDFFSGYVPLISDIEEIKPYLTFGIGFQHYDRKGTVTSLPGDSDNSFSTKFGPGVEYYFDKNWAMNLEAVYVYGDTGNRSTLDVYGWQFGGGVKYYF